jgi:hypothetical protein
MKIHYTNLTVHWHWPPTVIIRRSTWKPVHFNHETAYWCTWQFFDQLRHYIKHQNALKPHIPSGCRYHIVKMCRWYDHCCRLPNRFGLDRSYSRRCGNLARKLHYIQTYVNWSLDIHSRKVISPCDCNNLGISIARNLIIVGGETKQIDHFLWWLGH